jgi:predicted nucleic acid-binding protein
VATLNVKNLSDTLYRKLQARAKRERRSVAEEVTQILSDALETPKPLSILELRGQGVLAGCGGNCTRRPRARDVGAAAQLRAATGLETPDALQLVSALGAGCKMFVTNDRRLPSIPGLHVIQLSSYVAPQ